jgi:two-component system OmpR family response regulator
MRTKHRETRNKVFPKLAPGRDGVCMKTMIEPSASTATRLRTATARQAKTRVLIVDDNRRFAEGARAILQRTGQYIVCVETNALRALETARSFKPDLLLVDLVMPEIDGAELATQIGADWALHHVPIVFVTALITPEEASDGRRIDGHRISAKPHTAAELLRVVEESLPSCAEA